MKEERFNHFEETIDKNLKIVFNDVINDKLNPKNWIYYRADIIKEVNDKPIVFIFPIGIPGMGKTYFIEEMLEPYFEKKNFKNYLVSSDKIMQELMGDSKDKGKQKREVFDALKQQTKGEFD